jgi:hypothetical protein
MKCFDMPVYGLHGESHAAPMSTIPAFWGALGAGADGIALGVQMTGDGVIICCPGDALIDKDGGEVRVRDMTVDEIREFDAGARFRSVELDSDKGLVISIMEGGSYSGGAGVTVMPVHGPFDACVDVFVGNPGQGTTLEMACIGIAPGYFHIDNTDLNSRNVNLTFDVHGAPPYASSERDEADGYRIGWNNGYNLTRLDDDWTAASVNMYNKYGRDVGNGSKDNPVCSLRLQRCGSVVNAYYKDKYNHAWVLSGSALVGNLGPDVNIRLGAKLWAKGGMEPPANHVVFSRFRLYQF